MTNAKVIKEQTRTELLERIAFLERALEQYAEYCPLESYDNIEGEAGFFHSMQDDEGFADEAFPELAQYLREREVANGELISESRNALPALLDENAYLRKALEQARQFLEIIETKKGPCIVSGVEGRASDFPDLAAWLKEVAE